MHDENRPNYERDEYRLLRHEVIAPAVRNDGKDSWYTTSLAAALTMAGFNWTAVDTLGSWNGKTEAGRQFTIFAPEYMPINGPFHEDTTAEHIGRIARRVMPDQNAIQVVVDCPVRLIEA